MTAESVRRGRTAATMVLAVCLGLACGASGVAAPAVGIVPLVAQGAAGVVAPGGMEQMAKKQPQKPNVPAGGQPPAAAPAPQPDSGDSKTGLLKYAPSYVLLVLCVGLGLFIICRPMSRRKDDDD